MKPSRLKPIRAILLMLVGASLAALSAAQSADYFQNYPGGSTRAVYRVLTQGLSEPLLLTLEVRPAEGDRLTVRSTTETTGPREELALGISEGVARLQLELARPAITALLQVQQTVSPHQTVSLPNGAQFVGGRMVSIAGVPAVVGELSDPAAPQRRVIIALSAEAALPFPPLLEITEGDRLLLRLELIAFHHG